MMPNVFARHTKKPMEWQRQKCPSQWFGTFREWCTPGKLSYPLPNNPPDSYMEMVSYEIKHTKGQLLNVTKSDGAVIVVK
jgi:hypothetical protein